VSALLLVEDDSNVATTLTERLTRDGFAVTHAASVAAARQNIATHRFSIALLDVGLPDGEGYAIAEQLREVSPQTAVLFLTARSAPDERIRGLELGADDYLTKPFVYRELLLRVQNVQRRAGDLQKIEPAFHQPIRLGIAEVDFAAFTARSHGQLHRLTHKECAVLKLLAQRAGQVVSRDEILNSAWAPDEFPTARTVDNFILRLRKLVEPDPTDPRVIRSVRGVGYQYEARQ
jgi:two-component system, OmpR family, alkaline phosphatase synthesis response regulator PhoP